jgi:hypothetical protein
METFKQLLVIFVFFVLPGTVAAWIASSKGRSMTGWFLMGFFFPPTLMIIIFQAPLREVKGHYRICSSCREFIKWKEISCKYCLTPVDKTE